MIITEPLWPGRPDHEYYEYLATIGLTKDALKKCYVKLAVVVGLASRQNVKIKYTAPQGEVVVDDVPVWIHTDIGTRKAMVKGEEATLPEDYFEDAALMFPMPEVQNFLEPQVLVAVIWDAETNTDTVLGVIHILQNLNYVFPEQEFAPPTYRPHILFTFMTEAGETDFLSLYNVLDDSFAVVPHSAGGIPTSLTQTQALTLKDTALFSDIAAYIGSAIPVTSSECFTDLHFTSGDYVSHGTDKEWVSSSSWITSGTLTFKERDTGETITIRRDLLTKEYITSYYYDYVDGRINSNNPIVKSGTVLPYCYYVTDGTNHYSNVSASDSNGIYAYGDSTFTSLTLNTFFDNIDTSSEISNGTVLTQQVWYNGQFYTQCWNEWDWKYSSYINNSAIVDSVVDFNKCFLYDTATEVFIKMSIVTSHEYSSHKAMSAPEGSILPLIDTETNIVITDASTVKFDFLFGNRPRSGALPHQPLTSALARIKSAYESTFPSTTVDVTSEKPASWPVWPLHKITFALYLVPYDVGTATLEII